MFVQLWLNVMLPLFFYVCLGYGFQRMFHLDLKTLTNLLVYLFLPVMVFLKMVESSVSWSVAGGVLVFLFIQFLVMSLVSYLVAKGLKLPKPMIGTFSNSIVLNNSGNLGLPVHALVFNSNPFALSIGVFVVMFQNLMTFTVGVYNAEATVRAKDAIVKVLKLPILYSMILGIIFQLTHVSLPKMVTTLLDPIATSFAPFALLTLGAQLAATADKIKWKDIGVSSLLRLIGAPLIAYCLIQLIGFEGIVAQVLFIGSAFPSSRNSALLSFSGPYASFAGQTVLSSTILSVITLPVVIHLSEILF